MRGLGNWVDMSHDYAHSLNPAPARQHPPLRRRLPMPAYEPPPKYSEFLQRMLVRARESLGEEFRGITADGIVRPGLFPVRKTGVSLEPILRAARDFLATLDSRQQPMHRAAVSRWRIAPGGRAWGRALVVILPRAPGGCGWVSLRPRCDPRT